jgi:hypothetical protein
MTQGTHPYSRASRDLVHGNHSYGLKGGCDQDQDQDQLQGQLRSNFVLLISLKVQGISLCLPQRGALGPVFTDLFNGMCYRH